MNPLKGIPKSFRLTFLLLYVEDLAEPEELRLPDWTCAELACAVADCGGLATSPAGFLLCVER